MLSNILNSKTLTLSTRSVDMGVSYILDPQGGHEFRWLLQPQNMVLDLPDLMRWVGGDWLFQEMKELLPEVTEEFVNALEAVAFTDGRIAIGEIASFSSHYLNAISQKRSNGSRLTLECCNEQDIQNLILDLELTNSGLKGVCLGGNLTLFGIDARIGALYNPSEGWEFQLSTDTSQQLDLSELLEKFLSTVSLPTDIPAFKLSEIQFISHPRSGVAHLSANLNNEWEIQINNNSLAIRDMSLSGDFIREGIQQMSLTGELTLFDLTANVTGSYQATGWSFDIKTDETLSFEELSEKLPVVLGLPAIDDSALPEGFSFPELEVSGISLFVQPSSGAISLRGNVHMTLQLAGKLGIELTLGLHYDKQNNLSQPVYHFTTSAKVEFGETSIVLDGRQEGSDEWIFSSADQGNKRSDIGDITKAFWLQSGLEANSCPPIFDGLSFKDLFISYNTTTADYSFRLGSCAYG